jgi:membrane-associated phospholipid phosphatase
LSVPLGYDVHVSAQLGKLLGRHPVFDLVVQSGIAHGLLGGFWYAATLFYFWVKGAGAGAGWVRTRVLTVFAGVGIAIILALLAANVVSWPPPSQKILGAIFPSYLMGNFNANSFPSVSTAMYTAVALGVYTLRPLTGSFLLAGIPVLIAFPRIYVGGHYLTDVVVGFVLGVIGFVIARATLARHLERHVQAVFATAGSWRIVGEVLVFIAIWQIAVEFKEVIWLKRAIPALLR